MTDESASVAEESVTYPANGGTGTGFVARPNDGQRHPGVVVIQEWWGLEEHIKDVVRRLAGEGFMAIAPDLYHGAVATEPDEARKLAMALNRDQAAKEMDGAVDYLRRLPAVEPKRVGMIGFCMGGSLTLFMACHNPDIGAAAVFYGGNLGELDAVKNLHCALFAAYGERDESIPMERIEALRSALQAANKQFEIKVYPGAPHSFFNDTRSSHRPEAANDAWSKSLTLFREHLSPRAAGVA